MGHSSSLDAMSLPDYRSCMTGIPYPSYPSLTTGPPPRRASVSPQPSLEGAAGIARRPSWPPISVASLLEMYRREVERTAAVARQGPDDTAPAAAAAATIAETDNARDQPQPQAAPSQPPQHRDISRLLQSTDQLAEQLQRASDRLTYLTDFAGESATDCCRCPVSLVACIALPATTHLCGCHRCKVSDKAAFWQLACPVPINLLHVSQFAALHCLCKCSFSCMTAYRSCLLLNGHVRHPCHSVLCNVIQMVQVNLSPGMGWHPHPWPHSPRCCTSLTPQAQHTPMLVTGNQCLWLLIAIMVRMHLQLTLQCP